MAVIHPASISLRGFYSGSSHGTCISLTCVHHDILSTMPRARVFHNCFDCLQEFEELKTSGALDFGLGSGGGFFSFMNPKCSQALTNHLQKSSSSGVAPNMGRPAEASSKNIASPPASGTLWAVVVAVMLFWELGG
jgi:hypothetical protein